MIARRLAGLMLLLGCQTPAPASCPEEADAGVDALECHSRVVLGPVNIPDYYSGIVGIGQPCSWIGVPYALRVSFFEPGGGLFPVEHGFVTERVASCDPATDYLDLGDMPPGEYDIAIESVSTNAAGNHTLLGADLIRDDDCREPGGLRKNYCRPIRLTVVPCRLSVAAVALNCEDSTNPCVGP